MDINMEQKKSMKQNKKELENVILPILTKGMDPSAMGGMPGMSGMSRAGSGPSSTPEDEPKIEEID